MRMKFIGFFLIFMLLTASAGCIGGGKKSSPTPTSTASQTTSSTSGTSSSTPEGGTKTTPTQSSQSSSTVSTSSQTSSSTVQIPTTRPPRTSTTPRKVTVTFVVSVPDYTPEDDAVYIAGDFNGWNPGDENYRLTRLPDGRWAINLTFPYGKIIEFKFTRGSWETVEKGSKGEEIPNRRFVFTKPGTYEFKVYNWRDYVEESVEHTITGNVKTFKMFIPQLNTTRRIWIYLPPDYNTSKKRYPVLYMFDGQNLFDSATSFVGEWGVDEALEKLYQERNFSIIVVGIDHGGKNRIDEYAPWVNENSGEGGLGNATLKFIVENLKPFIDAEYRTDPEKTGIMGSSLGGLMALYAGFAYPDVFRYVGAMSSAFWFNPEIYDFVRNAEKGPEKIYIDWGTMEGSDPGAFSRSNEEMVSILKEKGYVEGVNLKVVIDEGAQHNEYYWGKRFPDAVLWLFGG